MAWRCTGVNQRDLCDKLWRANLISSRKVYDAMLATDRSKYTRPFLFEVLISAIDPYHDSPQRIIGTDATISAPHMHAHCLSLIGDERSDSKRILDVGCGSGYLLACFKRLFPLSQITGIDHVEELVALSRGNLSRDGIEGVDVVLHDGRGGYPPHAPYDIIHVGAAAKSMPDALVEQLKSPGVMIIPLGAEEQFIYRVRKSESGVVSKEQLFGVRYVPLC